MSTVASRMARAMERTMVETYLGSFDAHLRRDVVGDFIEGLLVAGARHAMGSANPIHCAAGHAFVGWYEQVLPGMRRLAEWQRRSLFHRFAVVDPKS